MSNVYNEYWLTSEARPNAPGEGGPWITQRRHVSHGVYDSIYFVKQQGIIQQLIMWAQPHGFVLLLFVRRISEDWSCHCSNRHIYRKACGGILTAFITSPRKTGGRWHATSPPADPGSAIPVEGSLHRMRRIFASGCFWIPVIYGARAILFSIQDYVSVNEY